MMESCTRRTRRPLRLFYGALLAAAAAAAMSPAGADKGHDHSATAASERLGEGVALIEARRLYLSNCAGCHGERGAGTDAASMDFADPQALVNLTRDKFREKLASGHGASGAALDEADREAITSYVRTYLMLPAPDADAELGRAIYSRSCSVCHGDRGDAASWAKNSLNPPPADFTAHSLEELSRQEMIDAVAFGKDRTAMFAFATQLNHEEIAATVDFIRTAFMREEAATGGHAGAGHDGHNHGGHDHGGSAAAGSDYPGGLVGDPGWGKAFYRANCAECHGETGDGKGPRAYFMIIKPANFLSRDMRAELDRATLFEHIAKGVNGTTMPAWEKVLNDQQIANVGEYVYRAFLHPDEPADGAVAPQWRAAEPADDGKKN